VVTLQPFLPQAKRRMNMDEKDKKLIEDIKTWEMSEEEKKHLIGCIRKDRRQKEAFMKLSKEERLKRICHDHIGYAFDHAIDLVIYAGRTTKEDFREAKRYLRNGLTWTLKEAKVLP
jgi:hypothetical protein